MGNISSTLILEKILHLRQKRHYSQEYMAEQLACSQNAYSKLERGRTRLTMERLQEIAHILDARIEDFFSIPDKDSNKQENNKEAPSQR